MRRIVSLFMVIGVLLGGMSTAAAAGDSTWNKPLEIKSGSAQQIVSGKFTGGIRASKDSPQAAITIRRGFTGTVVLDGVSVDLSGSDYACAIQVEAGASPKFVLKGKNILKSGGNRAGIEVAPKAAAYLGGVGYLSVYGGGGAAGIGGGNGKTCGTVLLGDFLNPETNNPRITATGGKGGAGIGGGQGGDGGSATLSSGLLNAVGGEGAQDIGGGLGGKAGTTTVSGGRLVRCTSIGWSASDSARRREVEINAHGYNTVHINPNIKGMELVYTTPVPSKGKPAATVDGMAYLYLPESVTKVDLVCGGGNTNGLIDTFEVGFGVIGLPLTDAPPKFVPDPPSSVTISKY